jgi:peptide subunit release factor 1 (eRF1)
MALMIAVKISDVREYGCPGCGYKSYEVRRERGYTQFAICEKCEERFLILIGGTTQSEIMIKDNYPALSIHPRNPRGIRA